jgi:RNase H-fold protein (predicted Holliday junction resolvase)
VSRTKRRDKAKVDEIAAVILLQSYLDTKHSVAR